MAKVLLVDDDNNLTTAVVDWLTSLENHIVDVIGDGQEASDTLDMVAFDLIILDWDLPRVSGIEILKHFRSMGKTTPVLMLTGHGSVTDKESCFDFGADDYLTKPFHIRELAARVRALLRRPTALSSNILKADKIALDPSSFLVTRDGQPIVLSKLEFAVLEFFMRHPNEVFSPDALLERVWPLDSERSPEGVRTLLKKLRGKIDYSEVSLIQNVHGRGYKFVIPEGRQPSTDAS